MESLVALPIWFKGFGILLEIFTALVALGVVYAGVHAYRVTKARKHLYFAGAFGLLAFSFIGRLFTALTVSLESFNDSVVSPVSTTLGVSGELFSIGHVGYVWLVLGAYAILLSLALKWDRKRELGVVIALTSVIAASSIDISWPFHLAALALLFCITLQHYLNYRATRVKAAYHIFAAFALLTLEPLMFLLARFEPSLVVAGYFVRLIAYVMILVTIWKVFSDE